MSSKKERETAMCLISLLFLFLQRIVCKLIKDTVDCVNLHANCYREVQLDFSPEMQNVIYAA